MGGSSPLHAGSLNLARRPAEGALLRQNEHNPLCLGLYGDATVNVFVSCFVLGLLVCFCLLGSTE